MVGQEYILIDKSVIAEGCAYDFSIFCANKAKSKVECIKRKGLIVQSDDIIVFDKRNDLYVSKSEHLAYKNFYKSHLYKNVRELNKRKNHSVERDNTPLTFTQKVEVMYQNASKALNELFNNPETLNNYNESKSIVNELVDSVLDSDFAIESLMCIATHDYYTHTHSINVAIYALSLGTFLGYSEEELRELGEAALLHDLGKSKISSAIINKDGPLTKDEFEIMQRHPVSGVSIGLQLGIKNKKILDGIKYHHEKIDGSGYPDGLYKNDIPMYAQIICLCDIFDALTSHRSYKKAMTSFEALKLMKVEMNKHIDVKLLNKMILMFR
ncbi:MAG: HD-GYP domain-containing protein [Thiovulaceae bacterium]|nr:HD-GYP domain-containing protein [Sulfurimonadaceae bacterium]